MDLSQYLEIFIDESKEHLQTLNDQVLILESEPENVDTVNEIFRAAHSLKGMAGTMGYKRMQRLTHDMENVFSEIRNGKMNVNADLVDIVFKCLDALEGYLTNIIETSDEGTEDNDELIAQLNAVLQNGLAGSGEAQAAATKEETKEEKKPEGGDRRKYLSIPLADFEKNAISEAKAQGMHVYATTVYIQETCLLKAARAFLVFKGLENKGEIIKSVPSVQDIEDEKFDLDFSMFIISDKSLEEVKKAIENVSEIEEAVIEEYELKDVNRVAAVYTEQLRDCVKVPEIPEGYLSSWAQYSILLKDKEERDSLQAYLKEQDVPSMIYYPKGMHQQTAFAGCELYGETFKVSEDICGRVLALPLSPYLTEEDQQKVIRLIREKTGAKA